MWIFFFRLTANQISSALKVSLGGQNSCELSNEYEEFFLNSADDITELLKKLPRVSASNLTHLQAQQVVCSMVQVCVMKVCVMSNNRYICEMK